VSSRLEDFGTETVVAVVTFTDTARLLEYSEIHDLDFPVLTDPSREAYHAYGLGRGSVRRVWGWRATRRYWNIVREGSMKDLRRPVEDSLQLGGDFVIDPQGILSYGFWGDGPDDRPPVEDLIRAVTGL
jgi:hypothetical protein